MRQLKRSWNHTNIKTLKSLKSWIKFFECQKTVGWDIETEGTRWYSGCKIAGMGFGCIHKKVIYTIYVPIGHWKCVNIEDRPEDRQWVKNSDDPNINLSYDEVLEVVYELLVTDQIRKITANGKFDAHFVKQEGIDVGALEDIQLLARILRTDYENVSLDVLVTREFKQKHMGEKNLKEWWRKNKIKYSKKEGDSTRYAKAPPNIVGNYCGEDVKWTLLLGKRFSKELAKDKKLKSLYTKIEKPLLRAVFDMEEVGVAVDNELLNKYKEELVPVVERSKIILFDEANEVFNPNSHHELNPILKRLKVPPEMRRRKGRESSPSYDAKCLEKRKDIPFVANLLKYRAASKLQSSFIDNMMGKGQELGNGKLLFHSNIRQESARTGRMSITDPPLQTMPRYDEDKHSDSIFYSYPMRNLFVPFKEQDSLLCIDFSNIEYRLLAHFSGDLKLLNIYAKGDGDFHGSVARTLGIERSIAKTFNFAQLYGSGVVHLSEQTGVDLKSCKKIIREYRREYPGVERFKIGVGRYCERFGGIRNPFGRWRELSPELSYVAVNTLIQSTAADIMKLAIIRVRKYLKGKFSKLLFPVHDELIINWDLRDGDIVHEIVERMETFEHNGIPVFKVPIKVDVAIAKDRWGTKKSIDFKDYLDIIFSDEKGRDDLFRRFRKNPLKKAWVDFIRGLYASYVCIEKHKSIPSLLFDLEQAIDRQDQIAANKKIKIWAKREGFRIDDELLPIVRRKETRKVKEQMGRMSVSERTKSDSKFKRFWAAGN